jgi:hypothetical protein
MENETARVEDFQRSDLADIKPETLAWRKITLTTLDYLSLNKTLPEERLLKSGCLLFGDKICRVDYHYTDKNRVSHDGHLVFPMNSPDRDLNKRSFDMFSILSFHLGFSCKDFPTIGAIREKLVGRDVMLLAEKGKWNFPPLGFCDPWLWEAINYGEADDAIISRGFFGPIYSFLAGSMVLENLDFFFKIERDFPETPIGGDYAH